MTLPDEAAIQRDIERTRAELGETVEALAAKLDVKARTEEVVAEAKDRLRAKAAEVTKSANELAHELRTQPEVPARRAWESLNRSVRAYPKQWAVAASVVLAFIALRAWRRGRR
jgi:hypothetical protein